MTTVVKIDNWYVSAGDRRDPGDNASPFDRIRRLDVEGEEYWSARELLMGEGALGYANWQNAENAVRRAMASCKSFGHNVEDHFTEVSNPIVSGKGGTQHVKDYRLSRYACYLVAMNGDPSKPQVAAAQTYFVVQTRRAELNRDDRWHATREAGKVKRAGFTAVLQNHGVHRRGFAQCTDAINRHALGSTAREFKERNGLAKNDATRDHCTARQLTVLLASEDLAAHRIERDDLQGNGPCASACDRAARQASAALLALYDE